MLKTSGNHHFLAFAASLALLSIASAASAAGSPSERPAELEVRVKRIVQLEPRADAEVVIPNLKAILLSDGSVLLRGRGTSVASEGPQGYDYEVDLASGTYTTRKLGRQEIEERDRLEKGSLKNQQSGDGIRVSVEKAIAPGAYFARARVQTRDPFRVLLAETMTSLAWTVSSSGTVTGTTNSQDGCWAANPSALGTHWQTRYCKWGGLYLSAGRVCNDNEGDYINWDYGSPTASTSAHHYVALCGGNDGVAYYSWDAYHRGEDWPYLTGTVVLG